MVSVFYLLILLVAAGNLLYLLIRNQRVISSAILLNLFIICSCLGRFLVSMSSSLDLAICGDIMVYLGGCFSPLMMMVLLATYSRLPMPKWMLAVMTFLSSFVFYLSLTIGSSDFFYKSIALGHNVSGSYLIRIYGPGHRLYSLLVLFYWFVLLYLAFKSLRYRKEIPHSTVAAFLGIAFPVSAAYCVELFFDTHISMAPLAMLITMLVLFNWIRQFDMYDLPVNIASSIEAMNIIGYIEFDDIYRCAGYNRKAKELFPNIEKVCPFGRYIEPDNSILYEKVILWMMTRKDNIPGEVQIGDRFYEMHVRDIPYHNNPCVGYILELVDRTVEKNYLASVASYNDQLKKDVARATEHISHMKDMIVVSMATLVESRDDSTGGHIKRTYQVMRTFSQQLLPHCQDLGMTPEFLEMVTRAAPMHDLGKIAIDDAVLKKQGRFTPEEYEIMKQHPAEGAKIVRHLLTGVESDEFVDIAENVAHYHHERWDGMGYPQGLKGEEIPLEARLMAFPDVCDALLSKRCYKEAFTYDQVFDIMEKSLGTQFDPKLGHYFIQCRPEIERMYEIWYQEDRDAKMLQLEPVRSSRSS